MAHTVIQSISLHPPWLYKLCGVMQCRVYQTEIKNPNDSKHCLVDMWVGIQQSHINHAINQ